MAKAPTPPVFRDLSRRTAWTVRLSVFSIVLMPILTFDYFVDYTTGQIIPTDLFLPAPAVEAVSYGALAALLVAVGSFPAFMMWTFRAAHNLRALGALALKTTPGWAVGWYFVPIANLWKPYQAGIEIWQASQSPFSIERRSAPAYLKAW